MPAGTETFSDGPRGEDKDSRREELAKAIEEFDTGETPTEDEVRDELLDR